jgi:phytoene dehydrogenase-like protein
MSKQQKVVIIGAGPGGLLSAAMILANRGFDVTVVEKADRVGGRTAEMKLGDYSFDLGPASLLYLGIDKLYADEPHHHVLFADDYQRNVDEIRGEKEISQDMSIYVRNSSVTDPTVAREGHSQLYILVPPVFESGRISSNLLCDAAGVDCDRVDLASAILAKR